MAVEVDVRNKACGKTYETFVLSSGRTFTKVTIVSVSDNGVLISHDGGLARLNYGDLSPAQRESFALSEEKAMLAERAQLAHATAYEKSIAVSGEVNPSQKKQKAEIVRADSSNDVSVPTPASSAKRDGPLSQAPKTVGNPNRVRRARPYSVYRGLPITIIILLLPVTSIR